ncbi:MAG: CidA/LrgA family protein [Lachnospiraceae bacterium]|nr:CidA/LrgA family protein [Lachnospiraceae bacterium]
MKWFKQFLVIILVSFIGEMCNYLIPLPVPGSIYGMLILFILLICNIIKVNEIKEVSRFLIDIMPILFIPSAVGIILKLDILKEIWYQILIITIVSTMVVMGITGVTTQFIIKRKKRKIENE